ncbi:hypothetical protein [Streptomyces wuyuanensis]|uniref:hypothetical protein n=1 Tax=Streptomyces wuyuanensis TaxID=1196353 RepID=UPI00371A0AB4
MSHNPPHPGSDLLNLHVRVDQFDPCGEFTIHSEALGFGEWSLELEVRVRAGRWRAFHLDYQLLDELFEAGDVDEEADEQLLLVHADHELPAALALGRMRNLGWVAIEAASFTVADASHRAKLFAADGFDTYLDGAHGAIGDDGEDWGIHLKFIGDGHAVVWVEEAALPGLVLVELK